MFHSILAHKMGFVILNPIKNFCLSILIGSWDPFQSAIYTVYIFLLAGNNILIIQRMGMGSCVCPFLFI